MIETKQWYEVLQGHTLTRYTDCEKGIITHRVVQIRTSRFLQGQVCLKINRPNGQVAEKSYVTPWV